jgi:hypothetical protein
MIEYFNSRVRMLSIFDLKLIQAAAMLLAVILVKLIPRILEIDMVWVAILLVICVIKPLYVFYFRRA